MLQRKRTLPNQSIIVVNSQIEEVTPIEEKTPIEGQTPTEENTPIEEQTPIEENTKEEEITIGEEEPHRDTMNQEEEDTPKEEN